MGLNFVTKNCTAADVWSDWFLARDRFNLSVNNKPSSAWIATVTLQRKFNSSSTTYLSVDTFTANIETQVHEVEDEVYYRAGIDTGHWSTGTVITRLSQ